MNIIKTSIDIKNDIDLLISERDNKIHGLNKLIRYYTENYIHYLFVLFITIGSVIFGIVIGYNAK